MQTSSPLVVPSSLDLESLTSHILSENVIVATLTIFYYDWLDSLPLEITEIWIQKFSFAQLLYLLARYIIFMSGIVQSIETFTQNPLSSFLVPPSPNPPVSPAACSLLYAVSSFSTIFGRVASLGLFTLRIWAIFPRNRYILPCLLSLILGLFIWATLSLLGRGDVAHRPSAGLQADQGPKFCDGWNPSFDQWYPVIVIGSLTFNTIVLSLTIFKTFKASYANRAIGMKKSLHWYLLRDGSLYYLAITVVDVIYLVQNTSRNQFVLALGIAPVNLVLETILTCRLVLNLKRFSSTPPDLTLPPIHFTSNGILGNIGAPLRDSDEDTVVRDWDID